MVGPSGDRARPATASGAWLRQTRVDRGLTQEELADHTGLSVRAIRDLEAGRAVPRWRTVDLLADVLGLGREESSRFEDLVRAGRARRKGEASHADLDALLVQVPSTGESGSRPQPPRYRPAQLPHDVTDLVGRQREIARLDELAEAIADGARPAAGVCVIDGPGGIGKTALAVHFGHHAVNRFPDGQLYADLRGFHVGQRPVAPSTVLGAFLRSVGVPAGMVPTDPDERSALFRSVLAGRRMLIVLDNATSASQVRALLPGASGCLVLVTSRRRLAGLVSRDAAVRITLEPLDREAAIGLLANTIGRDRVADDPPAADALAELSGDLPLALRITAEHVLAHSKTDLRVLVAELSAQASQAESRPGGGIGPARSAIAWSGHGLDPTLARFLQALATTPTLDITPRAAAALADRPARQARRLLDGLVERGLLDGDADGRYRLHDLLRAHAFERCDDRDAQGRAERRLSAGRMIRWYLAASVAADRAIAPHRHRGPLESVSSEHELPVFASHQEAAGWCDREAANLVASARHAAARGEHRAAWQLPWALLSYFDLRKSWDDWLDTYRIGLAAARAGHDRFGEAAILTGLGRLHYYPRRFAQALAYYRHAGGLWREIGDRHGEASILNAIGNVHLARRAYGAALDHYGNALAIDRAVGYRHGEGVVLNNLAETHCDLRAFERALDYASVAVAINHETGFRRMEAFSLCHLARAEAATGRMRDARGHFAEAIDLAGLIGDRQVEAWALDYLGLAEAAAGARREAREHWLRAARLFGELGDPQGADVRGRLALAGRTDPVSGRSRADRLHHRRVTHISRV